MKRLAPIGLLILLLYNTFGLSFAVLVFQNDYQKVSENRSGDQWLFVKMHLPSIPYTEHMDVQADMEGLLRKGDQFYNPTEVAHENDTLYVTFKSNQAARDRFFELADAVQSQTDPELGQLQSPHGKAVKILSGLLKNYLPVATNLLFQNPYSLQEPQVLYSEMVHNSYATRDRLLLTPPPELV